MSTPEAVQRLLAAFPHLADRPVVSIPNGFAAEDFDGVAPARSDDTFRIVHTGYLHTELGLQLRGSLPLRKLLHGSVPGLDILTRSHVNLVEAVNRLLASGSVARRHARAASGRRPHGRRPRGRRTFARSCSCTATSRTASRSS